MSKRGSRKNTLFSSESVTEGHPDKLCDQISDAVLDSIIEKDPAAKVACETMVTTDLVVIAGEVSTTASVDVERIAREVIRDVGYTDEAYGIKWDTCDVVIRLDRQSPDILMGVESALEAKSGERSYEAKIGAGDQGMMFGYATNETSELMPLPIVLAHQLARCLAQVRKKNIVPYLRPDGKTQVTVEYDEKNRPVGVRDIVISAQHHPDVNQKTIEDDIFTHVIRPVIPKELLMDNTTLLINPTGRFVIGGPQGDVGLTGRKIIVDTYGGVGRHGGGAFSGKDPTKVDRSASYAARYVAKNIVAAGLAKRVEVQVAYAIGVANPISLNINTFGTAVVPEAEIGQMVREHFDLRPAAIIRDLDLRHPIYRQVASYGHFGRTDLDLSWEQLNKVKPLTK